MKEGESAPMTDLEKLIALAAVFENVLNYVVEDGNHCHPNFDHRGGICGKSTPLMYCENAPPTVAGYCHVRAGWKAIAEARS